MRGGLGDCSDAQNLEVEDCFMMHDEYFDEVYWYGGAESYAQVWPINAKSPSVSSEYTSSDIPWRFGNVLERYWLSSRGVYIYVPAEIPLHVKVHPNLKICLRSSFIGSKFRGASYSQEFFNSSTELRYTVCIADDINSAHKLALDTNVIDRPRQLPDLRMIQHPIWSTWARYIIKL